MHYNFDKDLQQSEIYINAFIEMLQFYGATMAEINNDNRYDIAALFNGSWYFYEVKADLKSYETGNVFIEYKCLNKATGKIKPSGLAVTQARYWIQFVSGEDRINKCLIAESEHIKTLIRNNEYRVKRCTKDECSEAHGFIIPIPHLESISKVKYYRGSLARLMRYGRNI